MYLNSFLSGVQQNHGYPTFTFCDFAFIEKWSYRLYTERLIATQKIKKYFIVILVILSRWKMIGVLQSFKFCLYKYIWSVKIPVSPSRTHSIRIEKTRFWSVWSSFVICLPKNLTRNRSTRHPFWFIVRPVPFHHLSRIPNGFIN